MDSPAQINEPPAAGRAAQGQALTTALRPAQTAAQTEPARRVRGPGLQNPAVSPALTEAQTEILADQLLSGLPAYKAAESTLKDFGVAVPLSSFPEFWQTVCVPRALKRRARAVELANTIAAEMKKNGQLVERVLRDAVTQKAFELAVAPNSEPDELKTFYTLILQARATDLSERKLKLERRKVAALEKKLQAAAVQVQKLRRPEPRLTEAERTAILDQVDEILGLK